MCGECLKGFTDEDLSIVKEASNGHSAAPLAAGYSAPTGKCGKVRPTKPSCMRWPPTDCWPRHAIIWLMLSGEPLEPHCAMHSGALRRDKAPNASFPQFSRTLPSNPFTSLSNDCSASQPGFSRILPLLYAVICSCARRWPSATMRVLMVRMPREGVTSSTPMENPRSPRKRAHSLDRRVMHWVACHDTTRNGGWKGRKNH